MSRPHSPAVGGRLPIATANKAKEQDSAPPIHTTKSDTVAALGHDIAQRVLQLRDEDRRWREQLTRIIIHALLGLPDEGLAELVEEPARIGEPRWDALLQGLVAWRCQAAEPRVPVPAWAKETSLDEAWAPFGGSIRDDGWYMLSVLSTPAALLHRGIVLDRRNLKEL